MAGKSSNKRRNAISGEGSPAEISPAADLIASNVDLISEILVRLPAKSLIRFKCVSKHWLSLISQPQFSTNHSTRNSSLSMSGLYFYSDSRLQSVSLIGNHGLPSLSFIDGIEGNESKPKIIHSCNGLLLFEMFFGTGYKPNSIYIVSNVTTQKYKVLPKPSELSIRIPILRGACLAFDPSKSPHYKVVVGSRYNPSLRDPWRVEIDLYNSESGNWKKILPPGTCYGRGVFLNGAIHWLSLQDGLLRFEVDAEEMIALPLPRGSNISKKSVKYFGECGDGLILIQTRSSSTMRCTTLELEGRTCRLISKYWVDLKTMGPAFPEMETFSKFYVLCVVKDEKKEDLTLVVAIPGKVIAYNMKSKTLGLLRDLVPGEVINDGVNGCAYPFIETLCPV